MNGGDQLHEVLGVHGVQGLRNALRDEEGVHDICDLYNAFDSNDDADNWALARSPLGRDEYSSRRSWHDRGKQAGRRAA